jgi:hypothetical protein
MKIHNTQYSFDNERLQRHLFRQLYRVEEENTSANFTKTLPYLPMPRFVFVPAELDYRRRQCNQGAWHIEIMALEQEVRHNYENGTLVLLYQYIAPPVWDKDEEMTSHPTILSSHARFFVPHNDYRQALSLHTHSNSETKMDRSHVLSALAARGIYSKNALMLNLETAKEISKIVTRWVLSHHSDITRQAIT